MLGLLCAAYAEAELAHFMLTRQKHATMIALCFSHTSCSLCLQYYINDRTAILVDQQQLPADSGVAMEIDASRPRDGLDYYVSTLQKVCPIPTPSKPHFKCLLYTDSVRTPLALMLPLEISNINTHTHTHIHTSAHAHIHTYTRVRMHTSTHPHMCTQAHTHTKAT